MATTQRLRGVLGLATTWGVAFSAAATTVLLAGLAVGVIPDGIFGARDIADVAVRGFIAGGLAGTLFAVTLMWAERRKTVASLTLGRVARWGFLGAGSLPFLAGLGTGILGVIPLSTLATASVIYGFLGAGMAVSTLDLARRAPEPEAILGERR